MFCEKLASAAIGVLCLSVSLTSVSSINWGALDCNHFNGEYGIDYCYDYFVGSPTKYVCLSDRQLAAYQYDNTECSGDATSTYYYGDNATSSSYDYSQFLCNQTSNCEFALMEAYTVGEDCSTSSRQFSSSIFLTGVCSTEENSNYGSYMASCTGTTITVDEYNNDDCSDDVANTTYYTSVFGGFLWDVAVYCSDDSGLGDCNSATNVNNLSHLVFVVGIISIAAFF